VAYPGRRRQTEKDRDRQTFRHIAGRQRDERQLDRDRETDKRDRQTERQAGR
jgi:hypothetical protein